MGTVAVDLHLVAEVVFAVAGSTEHGGQGILCRVAGARRERIKHAGRENKAEGQTLVTCCQVGIVAMEQLVADAHHTNALAGIAESLGAADEQHVIIGIMGYRRLEGSFEGLREVLPEVHSEVGQVFHDDAVVLGCQRADGLKFPLSQAYPRRVVGVGIDDGAYIAVFQIGLQLRAELIASVVVDVESLVFHALHLQLHLLYGEAGVDEEHGVLLLIGLRAGEERGKRSLHGASNGYTALGLDIDVDECLDEA